MSDTTNISWADSTWNPWRGCSKVSPGCKNCYAETLVNRFGGDFSKRTKAAPSTFNVPLRWRKQPMCCDVCGEPSNINHEGFCEGCNVPRSFHRRRVFLGSLMDWLDPEVPIEWLASVLDIIRRCPELDFMLLTKRPELFRERTGDVWRYLPIGDPTKRMALDWSNLVAAPANVWLGVSVEDQKRADERIPPSASRAHR